MPLFRYHERTTLAQIKERARICKANGGILVYAVGSPWWHVNHDGRTASPYHLKNGIPCDPCGRVLLQTDDPGGFIAAAICVPRPVDHYGNHGVRAFVAAYHGNVTVLREGIRPLPTALDTWEEYNKLIDEHDERKAAET